MAPTQNHLIELLPKLDRARLLAVCQPFELALSQVLCERGQATRHVYFPIDGFICQVAQVDGHPGLEVGVVGREGMLGVQVGLGVEVEPLRALVQGRGIAWCVTAAAFRRELAASTALQRVMNRYLAVLLSQSAASAGCLRFHLIGQRLARWLLMSQDRAHADSFHVTQDVLAHMLGVRRVGITSAALALKIRGLIEYHRGDMLVLDRAGLEAAACGCYEAHRRAYSDVMGRE